MAEKFNKKKVLKKELSTVTSKILGKLENEKPIETEQKKKFQIGNFLTNFNPSKIKEKVDKTLNNIYITFGVKSNRTLQERGVDQSNEAIANLKIINYPLYQKIKNLSEIMFDEEGNYKENSYELINEIKTELKEANELNYNSSNKESKELDKELINKFIDRWFTPLDSTENVDDFLKERKEENKEVNSTEYLSKLYESKDSIRQKLFNTASLVATKLISVAGGFGLVPFTSLVDTVQKKATETGIKLDKNKRNFENATKSINEELNFIYKKDENGKAVYEENYLNILKLSKSKTELLEKITNSNNNEQLESLVTALKTVENNLTDQALKAMELVDRITKDIENSDAVLDPANYYRYKNLVNLAQNVMNERSDDNFEFNEKSGIQENIANFKTQHKKVEKVEVVENSIQYIYLDEQLAESDFNPIKQVETIKELKLSKSKEDLEKQNQQTIKEFMNWKSWSVDYLKSAMANSLAVFASGFASLKNPYDFSGTQIIGVEGYNMELEKYVSAKSAENFAKTTGLNNSWGKPLADLVGKMQGFLATNLNKFSDKINYGGFLDQWKDSMAPGAVGDIYKIGTEKFRQFGFDGSAYAKAREIAAVVPGIITAVGSSKMSLDLINDDQKTRQENVSTIKQEAQEIPTGADHEEQGIQSKLEVINTNTFEKLKSVFAEYNKFSQYSYNQLSKELSIIGFNKKGEQIENHFEIDPLSLPIVELFRSNYNPNNISELIEAKNLDFTNLNELEKSLKNENGIYRITDSRYDNENGKNVYIKGLNADGNELIIKIDVTEENRKLLNNLINLYNNSTIKHNIKELIRLNTTLESIEGIEQVSSINNLNKYIFEVKGVNGATYTRTIEIEKNNINKVNELIEILKSKQNEGKSLENNSEGSKLFQSFLSYYDTNYGKRENSVNPNDTDYIKSLVDKFYKDFYLNEDKLPIPEYKSSAENTAEAQLDYNNRIKEIIRDLEPVRQNGWIYNINGNLDDRDEKVGRIYFNINPTEAPEFFRKIAELIKEKGIKSQFKISDQLDNRLDGGVLYFNADQSKEVKELIDTITKIYYMREGLAQGQKKLFRGVGFAQEPVQQRLNTQGQFEDYTYDKDGISFGSKLSFVVAQAFEICNYMDLDPQNEEDTSKIQKIFENQLYRHKIDIDNPALILGTNNFDEFKS
jgi:HopA1 effector protein family